MASALGSVTASRVASGEQQHVLEDFEVASGLEPELTKAVVDEERDRREAGLPEQYGVVSAHLHSG